MRRFLTAVLVLIAGLALAAYLLFQSPERLLRSLVWAVDTLTPLHLELRGPVLDAQAGHYQVDEILLFQDGADRAPLLAISGFDARTHLQNLVLERLRNTELKARNVTVYVAAGDDAEDPTPAHWLRYLRWLPASLEIDSVHVVTSGERTRVVPLKTVSGRRLDERRYRLHAAADYDGEPLDVTLYLYALRSAGGFRGVELRGEFHATHSSRLAIVEGELLGGTEAFGYDLSLDAAFPDVRSLLEGFGEPLEIDGALQVRGRVRGDAEAFALTGATFHLLNAPEYSFSATGSFRYRGPGDTMLQLQAEGRMARLGYLVDWIDLDLSSLGGARATLELKGPLHQLAVEHFTLNTAHRDGLQVDVSGRLGPGALSDVSSAAPSGGDSLRVSLKGPNLAVLKQWLGESPVDPGPWQVTGTLHGALDGTLDDTPDRTPNNSKALQVSDIEATLGEEGDLKIHATGTVGRIDLKPPFSPASVSGIDLSVDARAPSPERFNDWLGLSLPEGLALSASATLSGRGDALAVGGGSARASGSDLDIELAGLSGRIVGGDSWRPADFEGRLSAALSDTSALSQYLEYPVPVLGEVHATARLAQAGERFALEQISGGIDSEHLYLKAGGRIGDLAALRDTAIDLEFSRLDIRNLLHSLREDFVYDQPLGQLTGTARLVQDGARWNLVDLQVDNNDKQRFTLSARGALRDLAGLPHGDLDLDAATADRGLLRALTGRDLPDLRLSLQSRAGDGAMNWNGEAGLGETRFSTRGRLDYSGDTLTGLSATLESPHVRLVDVGLQASEETAPAASEQAEESASHPLERLIESLPDYPLDLALHLGGISGEQTRIDRLDAAVTGDNGQFLLRQLNANYDGARAEVRGVIDLRARPPAISLGGQALAVDLTRLVRDLGISSDIQGKLNLRGGLSARGSHADAWLRSLDGSVALALEDAVIQGAAYDVLATDLLAWLYSGAALEKSTHLQCTMARFALNDGVASTDSLFVESPRMIASGEGQVNFVERTLDITLTPRSRDRLFEIPSSVRLHGKLDAPRTRVSAIAATADASAEALTLIPKLTMKLFGIKVGHREAPRPCEASLSQ